MSEVAERLVAEMTGAWREGGRPQVEAVFQRYPEWRDNREVALQLIFAEISLRQEAGEEPASVALLGRFPQWRQEVKMLLECHRLFVTEDAPAPQFPKVGERLGDFHLLAELGRGACGRVFLASQPSLADRPVALKVTPREGTEHLALARLQHAHIVPLYFVQDFPQRNLQGLCMPYLGGQSWADLLRALRNRPPALRTGRDLLDFLERAPRPAGISLPARGPAYRFLSQATFVQVVCWLGACLADALQYAHDHGLVHLDVKPSNVLLSADGQPMLLDFHLAREPLVPNSPAAEWVGGTPGYMAPEQEAALAALRDGRPVSVAVDRRADVYALGVVLAEAITGREFAGGPGLVQELRWNAQVSTGLGDILARCLAPDPNRRYPESALLSADLRRHLADLPLQGVANRSLGERWHKWRRRRPHALSFVSLALAVLAVAVAVGWNSLVQSRHQLSEARSDLAEGQIQLQQHRHAEACRALQRGLARVPSLTGGADLGQVLNTELQVARRGMAADSLHATAERVRFLYGVESLPRQEGEQLLARCRAAWDARDDLTGREGSRLDAGLEAQVRTDLLDLVILGTDLEVRLAPGDCVESTRREALRRLEEAEKLFGSSPVLHRERAAHAHALGLPLSQSSEAPLMPRTGWEHYAVGRSLFRCGELLQAAAEFERALDLQPQHFWMNFFHGLCCYRLQRYSEALLHFQVCVALAPNSPECFCNRALAHAALGDPSRARRDYDRALELEPGLAGAALNRGLLHYREKHYSAALADIQTALANGAAPAAAYCNLALIYLAQGNRTAACANLAKALRDNPNHKESRALLDRLQRRQ